MLCYDVMYMAIRIAINGLGRIGRTFLRKALERKELEIVAVNDLAEVENLAYLLRYDSVYGPAPFEVSVEKNDGKIYLSANHAKALFFNERDPSSLPWRDLKVDVVVEATGVFASYEKSNAHIKAGTKRVVITAPVKDDDFSDVRGETVLMGVNDDLLKNCSISSNASCTTNAGSPIISILHETIGIEKALLNTVHGYTATQSLVDAPDSKDFRRGRAAAVNIIPSTTGAAISVTKAIPALSGKFDGIALRVPVPTGSIADITGVTSRATSAEEINKILTDAAKDKRWSKVFSVTEDPIVSSDIIGSRYASIADLSFTKVVDGNLFKVLAWYDNEMGYVQSLIEHVIRAGEYAVGE
jgi:glyceraldehyde 3-phosphate dehydrogenase